MRSTTSGQPLRSEGIRRRPRIVRPSLLAWLVGLAMLSGEANAAQPSVGLGTADSFAGLAGSTVTNTGPSTLNGDLGLSPGAALTGFPPGTVNGTLHAADAVAAQAQTDLRAAYADAAGRTPPVPVSGDLGGIVLNAGVFASGSALRLTGVLTLDAQGDPDAVFIIRVGSALTTASGSRVTLLNRAQSCHVFWTISSSATLGTSSVFVGSILARGSISIDDGVTLDGRALALGGALTLINDTIGVPRCATAPVVPGAGPPATAPAAGTAPGAVTPGTIRPGTVPAPPIAAGAAVLTTTPRAIAQAVARSGISRCVRTEFRALVTGRSIRDVVFSLGERHITTQDEAPFAARVEPHPGVRILSARVRFMDATPAVTLRMRFKSCHSATRRVPRNPAPAFTG